MLKTASLALLLAALAMPAFAAAPLDREAAISTLAGFYYSADACALQISRVKIDAYRAANTPKDDAMFNVDVFRATQALYKDHDGWTKDQTTAWCKTALDSARTNGVLL